LHANSNSNNNNTDGRSIINDNETKS